MNKVYNVLTHTEGVSYTPGEETQDEVILRDFLRLRESYDPVYVTAAMAAVYSFPNILSEFSENDSTLNMQSVPLSNFSVENATLISKFGKSVGVSYLPRVYPFSEYTVISYVDNNLARINYENSIFDVPCSLRSSKFLDISWPKEVGIKGILDLGGNDWQPYYKITIKNAPKTFPYEICAQKLIENVKIYQFLEEKTLLTSFFDAKSGVERIAIACLAFL